MKTSAVLAIAIVLPLVVAPLKSAPPGEVIACGGSVRPPSGFAVYAKVLLPVAVPAGHASPAVESWIDRQLRQRGVRDFRAATGWVRLADHGRNPAELWNATLDGRLIGCPVDGSVGLPAPDGKVTVALVGWSPFGADISGATLRAEPGHRRIAVVDPDSGDGEKIYVALLVAPSH